MEVLSFPNFHVAEPWRRRMSGRWKEEGKRGDARDINARGNVHIYMSAGDVSLELDEDEVVQIGMERG